MAIPFIKHTPLGKATQKQPYTAAAHVRYISRASATEYIYAERMPLHYHAAQRFLREREDGIRKNGRVCDKLVISLPREMNMDQAVTALRDFGFRLSKGRAPFYFTIQDWNEHNPHCHFIYVDADVESGERVFKTTDRHSTDRIKELWEKTCNEHLQELGIEARISFREAERLKGEKLEKEEEAARVGLEDGPAEEAANRNAPIEQIEAQGESADVPAIESDEEDDDVAEIVDHAPRREDDPEGWLKAVRADAHNIRMFQRKKEELATATREYGYWQKEERRASAAAIETYDAFSSAQKRLYAAEQRHDSTHIFGWRKGFALWKFKSEGYRRAEMAEIELNSAKYEEAFLRKDVESTELAHQVAKARVSEYQQKLYGVSRQIERVENTYGEQIELETAERDLLRSFDKKIQGMTPTDFVEMYEDGDISWMEAKEYLHMMGHDDVAEEYEAELGEGQGR